MSHHQKTVIVDSRLAFVGGIDMMVERGGDFDRWDTKGHHFLSKLRLGKDGKMPHSWHDVHIMFEGPGVADVEDNFRQRWNAVVELHKQDSSLLLPEPFAQLPSVTTKQHHSAHTGKVARLQVTRTIPKGIYSFTPQDGIATILDTYKQAIARATCFIYIENQYFWRRTFLGFENPGIGIPHPEMEELLHLLAEALARGVIVTLLLPDNPNVGREFTDEGLKFLWELAPHAVTSGALQAYTLGSSSMDDQTLYRSIYVHSKTMIVDDTWFTLGSANLNNRGMCDDTEMNVALEYQEMARRLRILLMAEHLGLCEEDTLFWLVEKLGRITLPEAHKKSELFMRSMKRWLYRQPYQSDSRLAVLSTSPVEEQLTEEQEAVWRKLESQLSDPLSGRAMFAKQAKENLQSIKSGQPLVGHLLPYIPYDRALDYEVDVHSASGWLDALSGAQEESASTEGASAQ